MEEAQAGDEAAERPRGQERLEGRRRGQNDAGRPEPAPGREDEEEPRFEEVDAEEDLKDPTLAALGHRGILVARERRAPPSAAPGVGKNGPRGQPRGEALRVEELPDREGGALEERDEEDGPGAERDGASYEREGGEEGRDGPES